MRASRLLTLLLLLHTRGRVSAQQLAAELEISLRTVYRDIEALNGAGIPIYATRGRSGGFQLLDGYRTKLTGLTNDEADALFLSGLPGAAADLGLGSVLAATQLKLLAALPPELRERAARIRDRFHLDAPGWLRDNDVPPCLPAVAESVWNEHMVRVQYERADRTLVQRDLEPLGLVLKAGVWYLVASVPADDRGPRTYRLSRLRALAPLDQMFRRPRGFDLEQHWAAYQRDYERRIFRATATIRLSAAGRALLFLIGSPAAAAGHAAMGEPGSDGWARTDVPIESLAHAQHALLQLGAEVEVLGPPELRALVATSLRAAARHYCDDLRSPDEPRAGSSAAGKSAGGASAAGGSAGSPSAGSPSTGGRSAGGGPAG